MNRSFHRIVCGIATISIFTAYLASPRVMSQGTVGTVRAAGAAPITLPSQAETVSAGEYAVFCDLGIEDITEPPEEVIVHYW